MENWIYEGNKENKKLQRYQQYNLQNDLKYKLISFKLISGFFFFFTDIIPCDWKMSQVLLSFCRLFTSSCVTLFYSLTLKCILHTDFQAQFTAFCKKLNSQN